VPNGPDPPPPYGSEFTSGGRKCVPVFTHQIMAPPVFVELLHQYSVVHCQFSEIYFLTATFRELAPLLRVMLKYASENVAFYLMTL
jgi:hypothetical protein